MAAPAAIPSQGENMNTRPESGVASFVATHTSLDQDNPATHRYELWLFGVALLLFNLPLLNGSFSDAFIFLPDAVRAGEWWRFLTHPFVHVSWLHLSLDGVAFVVLYHSLEARSKTTRLLSV